MAVAELLAMTTCMLSRRSFSPFLRTPRTAFVALAVILWLGIPTAASAQQQGVGVRVGVSGTPNQFYFGAHFDTGPFVDQLSFRPNVEIGVGDNVTTVAGNFEFAYWFPIPHQPWSLYAGGGPAVNVYHFGDNRGGGNDVKPGFNILLGVAHKGGFFGEIKAGLIDSPNVKFGVGYTWGR